MTDKKPIRIILRHTPTGAHGESLEPVYKTVDIHSEELERLMVSSDGHHDLSIVGGELTDRNESGKRLYGEQWGEMSFFYMNTDPDDLF